MRYAALCIATPRTATTTRRLTGHKSESTLAEYFREAYTLGYNIVAKLGL